MGDIFNQVGQAFVQAIPTVIFVAILVVVLKRLFFNPLGAVLQARRDQSEGARARAQARNAEAEKRAAEYEEEWRRGRQEVYSALEAARRDAVAGRDEIIQRARLQAEASVKQAQQALAERAEAVRAELSRSSASLASRIAADLLVGPESPAAGEVQP